MIQSLRIESVTIEPLNVPLAEDFEISQGKLTLAENLLVRLQLAAGVTGFGEIAPFPGLTHETQAGSQAATRALIASLVGESAAHYRRLSEQMSELAPDQPAARCGLEMAILDALARTLAVPLWAWAGGAAVGAAVTTDITIPIVSQERTLALASKWYERGFRRIKTKVGLDAESDIRRITAVAERYPDLEFILDANQGFNARTAAAFVRELERAGARLVLLEQPVHKNDLEGMASLRRQLQVPVAADESVASPADALRVIGSQAADVINLKIMKSGVLGAMAIWHVARAAGLRLMIGGMMETRLAMSCSLALAYGLEGIQFVDLDTPLLLAEDPFLGGYRYEGSAMTLWQEPGLGLIPAEPADLVA
jgi:o-succinylbenzoate synthase